MRDYRRIHTAGKRIMTLQTFAEFERQISPNIICRVHKSYMISLDKIDSIEKSGIKIKDRIIPISETYKKRFFSLINHSTNSNWLFPSALNVNFVLFLPLWFV